jgi:hypothetical protein
VPSPLSVAPVSRLRLIDEPGAEVAVPKPVLW